MRQLVWSIAIVTCLSIARVKAVRERRGKLFGGIVNTCTGESRCYGLLWLGQKVAWANVAYSIIYESFCSWRLLRAMSWRGEKFRGFVCRVVISRHIVQWQTGGRRSRHLRSLVGHLRPGGEWLPRVVRNVYYGTLFEEDSVAALSLEYDLEIVLTRRVFERVFAPQELRNWYGHRYFWYSRGNIDVDAVVFLAEKSI